MQRDYASMVCMSETERLRPYAATGRRMKQLRALYRESQEQLAADLHCKQPTYSGYESGSRQLTVEHAIQLRTRWNVTLDYLYLGIHGGVEIAHYDNIRRTPIPKRVPTRKK